MLHFSFRVTHQRVRGKAKAKAKAKGKANDEASAKANAKAKAKVKATAEGAVFRRRTHTLHCGRWGDIARPFVARPARSAEGLATAFGVYPA